MVVLGCGPVAPLPEPAPAEPTPAGAAGVLLVGIDAAGWDVLDGVAAVTPLPAFESLARSGVRAPLATLRPTLSPNIWTTIATGKLPAQHGIESFVMRQVLAAPAGVARPPAASQLARPAPLLTSASRRVPALWNIASHHHVRCAVLGWWVTWPVETVDGLMVSDRFLLGQGPGRVHPPAREAEIGARGSAEGAPLELPVEAPADDGDLLRRWSRSDRFFADLALGELADPETKLVMVYLRGFDPVQHRFWKYWRPDGFDLGEVPAGRDEAIPRYARFLDGLLAELVAAARGRTLLVVSDHGMRGVLGTSALLDMAAVMRMVGEDAAAYGVTGSLLPADGSLRVVAATQAGDLGRLAERLAAVRCGAANRPLFTRIDRLAGGAALVVAVDRGLRGNDVVRSGGLEAPLRELTLPPPAGAHTGSHESAPDGILLMSGGPVRRGVRLPALSVVDVAPTILHLLGLPLAEDMPGRVPDVFVEPSSDARVATYDDIPRVAAPSVAASAEEDERLREELRTLGYLH